MAYSERSPFPDDIERLSELDLHILQSQLAEFSDHASRSIEEIDDRLSDEEDSTERAKLETEKAQWVIAKEKNSAKLAAVSKKLG